MKNFTICFLLFTVVSCITLFAMKYILWAMFKWGGGGAISLALMFTCIYVGSFFAFTKKWARHEQYVSLTTLKLIWALGFVQLAVLEVLLVVGIVVLYGSTVEDPLLLVVSGLAAGVSVAATGTLYGALASVLGVRETLLPILLLPVLAPVLIGATRAFDDALGAAAVDGWAWLGLLVVFGLVATVLGALAHGVLIED